MQEKYINMEYPEVNRTRTLRSESFIEAMAFYKPFLIDNCFYKRRIKWNRSNIHLNSSEIKKKQKQEKDILKTIKVFVESSKITKCKTEMRKLLEYFVKSGIFEDDFSIFQLDTGHLGSSKFGLSLVKGDTIFPIFLIDVVDTACKKLIMEGLQLAASQLKKEYVVVKDGGEVETKRTFIGQVGSAKFFARKLLKGCEFQLKDIQFRIKRSFTQILGAIYTNLLLDSGMTKLDHQQIKQFLSKFKTYADYYEWKKEAETIWKSGLPSEAPILFQDLLDFINLSLDNLEVTETSIETVKKMDKHLKTLTIGKDLYEQGIRPSYLKSVKQSPGILHDLMLKYGNKLALRNFNLIQHEYLMKYAPLIEGKEISTFPQPNEYSIELNMKFFYNCEL